MLTLSQIIAKYIGQKDGHNTYFRGGITHPNNIGIKLNHNTTISLGYLQKEHLKDAIKASGNFSNTFTEPLDK